MFKTFLLLFALTAFFIFVGKLLAGRKGMVIAFIVALAMNGASYWYSDTIVLKAYNARPVKEGHRLKRITREVADRAGIPMPKVYIIPSQSANAFATGRDPEHAAVAATEGILRILNDHELMGVMAHEIGHVKNRDTLTQTVAASISGGVLLLSRFALFFGGSSDRSWAKTIAISIIAPIAAGLITMAISREREYEADEFAAKLTGKPMSLASALEKLSSGVKRRPMDDHSPETAHMFIVNPFSSASYRELFSTHPSVKKRVERLSRMAGR
jgi:heat shock protein HtpX